MTISIAPLQIDFRGKINPQGGLTTTTLLGMLIYPPIMKYNYYVVITEKISSNSIFNLPKEEETRNIG